MNENRRIDPRRFMSVFMAIFIIALLVFSAVSAQNLIGRIRGSSEGVITGIVRDAETNYPIPNALMTLEYHDIVRTELTDSKGRYSFTGIPLCFCLKNVSASKEGYESQYKLVAVSKITLVDFSLEPIEDSNGPYDGVLTGIVTDAETNEPIPDALMALKYHDTVRTELADSKGQYTFTNVPLCFCLKNISAYKRGYESQYKLVPVSKLTYVNFSLDPIEGGGGSNEGVLTGVVIDAETNDPIHNALMTLIYHETVRTELTDSQGRYTFEGIPLCFCLKNISASNSGYESQYELVAVSEMTYANFSLEPQLDNDSGANADLIAGRTSGGEIPVESIGYYCAISGLVGTLVVLIVGIFIHTIKKKSHT